MTTEIVREALHSHRPFKVFTAASRCIEVHHPDFAMLSRSGRVLFDSLENDRTEAIDLLLVVSIEKQNGATGS